MPDNQQSSVNNELAKIAKELDRLGEKDTGDENNLLWNQFVGMRPTGFGTERTGMPNAPGPVIVLP